MPFDSTTGVDVDGYNSLMSEHESGNKSSSDMSAGPKDYELTPEQEKIVKMVMKKFRYHKKWRSRYDHRRNCGDLGPRRHCR